MPLKSLFDRHQRCTLRLPHLVRSIDSVYVVLYKYVFLITSFWVVVDELDDGIPVVEDEVSDPEDFDEDGGGLMFSDEDMEPTSPSAPAPVLTSVAESSAAPTSPDEMSWADQRRVVMERRLARIDSLNQASPGAAGERPALKQLDTKSNISSPSLSRKSSGVGVPKFSPTHPKFSSSDLEPTQTARPITADENVETANAVSEIDTRSAHLAEDPQDPPPLASVNVSASQEGLVSPVTEAEDDSTFADNESIIKSDEEEHREQVEAEQRIADGIAAAAAAADPVSSSDNEADCVPGGLLHDRLAQAINRGLEEHAQNDAQAGARPESDAPASNAGGGVADSGASGSMEGMYNRLKGEWRSDDRSVASSVMSDFSSNLKPVASSLSLSKGGTARGSKLSASSLGKSRTSLTASQVSNRLYNNAMTSRQKTDARTEAAIAQFDQMRADNRFHMNARSRQMVQSCVPKGTHKEVGHRLHEEGVKEIKERQDITDTKSKIPLPESWSCSRCAHLHDINPKLLHDIDENIVKYRQKILRELDRRNPSNAPPSPLTAESVEKEILRGVKISQICTQCGWDQTNVRPHKPCNVAKHLLLKGDKYKQHVLRERSINRGEMMFRHRGAAGVVDVPKISLIEEGEEEAYVARAGFFEEMHQNAAGEARKLDAMQTRLTNMEDVLTFRPTIPVSSRDILKESVARDKVVAEEYRRIASATAPKEVKRGVKGKSKDMVLDTKDLATPDVGEYFSIPPAERLYRNKIPNKIKDRRVAKKTAEGEAIQRELAEKAKEQEQAKLLELEEDQERDADAQALVEFEHNNEMLRMGTAPGKAGKGTVVRAGKPPKKLPIKTGSAAANLSLSAAEHAAQQKKVVMYKTHYKTKAEVDQYVDQLTYEYRARQERKRNLANQVLNYDQQTHQKLFQPKVEAYTPQHSTVYDSSTKKTGAPKDIFDDILRRDANALDRKKQREFEKVKEEAMLIKRNQATASHHSKQLLKEMTDRQTNAIFSTLCSIIGSVHQEQANEDDDDEGQEGEGEETEQLDLMEISADMLAEEVFSVVHEARNSLLRKNHRRPLPAKPQVASMAIVGSSAMGSTGSSKTPVKEPPLLITKSDFNKLIGHTLKQRKGVGNSYLAVRKKVPVVTLELMEKAQKEETFKPVVNKTSSKLSQHKGGRGTGTRHIADILIADGREAEAKIERQREEMRIKQIKSLSFQPKMYPPPRYISPRYKHRELPPAAPSPVAVDKTLSVSQVMANRGQNPQQLPHRVDIVKLDSPIDSDQRVFDHVSGRGSLRPKASSIDETYIEDDYDQADADEEDDGDDRHYDGDTYNPSSNGSENGFSIQMDVADSSVTMTPLGGDRSSGEGISSAGVDSSPGAGEDSVEYVEVERPDSEGVIPCEGENEDVNPEEDEVQRANEDALLRRISVSGRTSDVSALTDDAYQEEESGSTKSSPEYNPKHNRSGSSGSGATASTSQGYSLNMDMIAEGRDETLTPHDQARLSGHLPPSCRDNEDNVEEQDGEEEEEDDNEDEEEEEDGTVATHIKSPSSVQSAAKEEYHSTPPAEGGKARKVVTMADSSSRGGSAKSSPSIRQQPTLTKQSMNAPLTAAFISKSYSPLPVSTPSKPYAFATAAASSPKSSATKSSPAVSRVTTSPSPPGILKKTGSGGIGGPASGKSTPVNVASASKMTSPVAEAAGLPAGSPSPASGSAPSSKPQTPSNATATVTSPVNPKPVNNSTKSKDSNKSHKKKDGNKSTFKTLFGIS